MNIYVPHNKKDLDEKLVVQCYLEGFSIIQIAKLFECSKTPIRRILRENGIEIKTMAYYTPLGCVDNSRGGYVFTNRGGTRKRVHHLVMEEFLGRELQEDEQVHHINGMTADNRLENLQLRKIGHGPGQVWQCNNCGSSDISAMEL